MADSDFPAKQGNLTKLEEQGCRWSGDPGIAHRHKEDRMIAAVGGFEERRVATQQLGKGNTVHRSDLPVIFNELDIRPAPNKYRSNYKSRSGDKIVETADYPIGGKAQADFFAEFAKGCLLRFFAHLYPSARQSPLTRVVFHFLRPSGENQRRTLQRHLAKTVQATLPPVIDNTEGDGSPLQVFYRQKNSLVAKHIVR